MIDIRINAVKSESSSVRHLLSNVDHVQDDVRYVTGAVSSRVQSRRNIRHRLQRVRSEVIEIEDSIKALSNFLNMAADTYEGCERDILFHLSDLDNLGGRSVVDRLVDSQFLLTDSEKDRMRSRLIEMGQFFGASWWNSNTNPMVGNAVTGMGISYSIMRMMTDPLYTSMQVGKAVVAEAGLDEGWKVTPEVKFGNAYNKKAIKVKEQESRNINRYAYNKETGQMAIYETVPYLKEKFSVDVVSVGAKAENSIYGMKTGIKSDIAEANISADIGKAEAHAMMAAGIYAYDENGNMKFAPSVHAEVGASFSVLSVEADAKVGNDMLGANASVDIDVGKVEAKGVARMSVYDANGNLDIEMKAKASAEAVLFEVGGKAGVTVAGIDAAVSGKIKVGVGAHAEIGMIDGVVKVDIGASLGLGVDIGFEVDVEDAVKAVYGGAKSVLAETGDLIGDIGGFLNPFD